MLGQQVPHSLLYTNDGFPYPATGGSLTTGAFYHQPWSNLFSTSQPRINPSSLEFPQLHLEGVCDLPLGLLVAIPTYWKQKTLLFTAHVTVGLFLGDSL